MRERIYSAVVVLNQSELTSLFVLVDSCRAVGAAQLPLAISDEELRAASQTAMKLAGQLKYG